MKFQICLKSCKKYWELYVESRVGGGSGALQPRCTKVTLYVETRVRFVVAGDIKLP